MNYLDLKAECAKYGHTLPRGLPRNALYWCCHHEVHFEFVGNPYERIEYIVRHKPEHERARRLAEFRPIKGALGNRRLLKAANAARAKADAAWAKADAARDKADAARGKAYAARAKAGAALDKAYSAWAATFTKADAIALHRSEYPETKWNGKTIFPEAA
jgi:hypothetical protein